eukprot:CAMPEP_0180244970 /NCGR_PEP_ID=MMETSP0987-20121128/34731_1 /TAXON_ID=697907 /ORGANISM="non described non described, Strain CCMP2293" /LENGTH=123 /DNA_ID=CAMNT_0022212567 /DNA_START=194 /DNA_END=561 /DNA_ORIENTATION=+
MSAAAATLPGACIVRHHLDELALDGALLADRDHAVDVHRPRAPRECHPPGDAPVGLRLVEPRQDLRDGRVHLVQEVLVGDGLVRRCKVCLELLPLDGFCYVLKRQIAVLWSHHEQRSLPPVAV